MAKLTKDQKRKKKLKAKKANINAPSKSLTLSRPIEKIQLPEAPYKLIYDDYKKIDIDSAHSYLQSLATQYDSNFDEEDLLEEFVNDLLSAEDASEEFIKVLQSTQLKWSEIIDEVRKRGYTDKADKMLYLNRCIHEDLLKFKWLEEISYD